jgi:hypothetical protein
MRINTAVNKATIGGSERGSIDTAHRDSAAIRTAKHIEPSIALAYQVTAVLDAANRHYPAG